MAVASHAKASGIWQPAVALGFKISGIWRDTIIGYNKVSGIWQPIFQANLTVTISADTTIQNMRTLALAAGWDGVSVIDFILINNSAIYVRATTTSNYALDTGSPWPATSTLTLINRGYFQGKGGGGGAGANQAGGIAATVGLPGGHAINLQYPLSIDNGSGYILGGGGGGGGGGGSDASCNCTKFSCDSGSAPGGGGGGGGGTGAGGTATPNAVAGSSGVNNVTVNAHGLGGAGGTSLCSTTGGSGGLGGDWGGAGVAGSPGNPVGLLHANGGIAGKAINLNGHAVTWLSGNDPSRVKGLVS